VLLQPSK